MKNLVCKIYDYNQVQVLDSQPVPENLNHDQIVNFGLNMKKAVDKESFAMSMTPNIVRFTDPDGVYSWDMQ